MKEAGRATRNPPVLRKSVQEAGDSTFFWREIQETHHKEGPQMLGGSKGGGRQEAATWPAGGHAHHVAGGFAAPPGQRKEHQVFLSEKHEAMCFPVLGAS